MTELTPDDGPAAAQPSPDWPRNQNEAADPLLQHALDRLETLPQVPVLEHEAVYNVFHDELLAALNEDPAGSGPGAPNPAGGSA